MLDLKKFVLYNLFHTEFGGEDLAQDPLEPANFPLVGSGLTPVERQDPEGEPFVFKRV